ncbi:MAG TPA: hypothetical protein VK886_00130 [Vicinamibacterales bacterium]|nr:hypothetical protein [Vicinamibacterales bacterium]
MTPVSDERVLQLLRAELPVPDGQLPAADLWPRVERRIQEGSHPSASAVDWILAALVVLSCVLRPSAIGMLLLHI